MNDDKIDINILINYCEKTVNHNNIETNAFTEYISIKLADNFYYSLLYILHEDFVNIPINKKIYYINNLKNIILNYFKKNKKLFNKNTHSDIIDCLMSNTKGINDTIINLIVLFYDINIYIVNYNLSNIICYYSKDTLDIYKKNIFIEFKNNNYYPIIKDNNKFFQSNCNIIQQIKNNNSNYNVVNYKKEPIILFDINSLNVNENGNGNENENENENGNENGNGNENENENENKNENENENENEKYKNLLLELNNKNIKLNKTNLNKIKISELKELFTNNNIDTANKTKTILVQSILDNCC